MWGWFLLILFSLTFGKDSTFRFGAVTSQNDDTASQINEGYWFFFDKLKRAFDGEDGFRLGKQDYRFQFEFVNLTSNGRRQSHRKAVKKLLDESKVHFLGGTLSDVADIEMEQSNKSDVLNYHCCVGPGQFYENRYTKVFGIQAASEKYTHTLIRSLQLSGLKKISFVYETDNAFRRSTCESGIDFWRDFTSTKGEGNNTIFVSNATGANFEKLDVIGDVARNSKMMNTEAVIACVSEEHGRKLVEKFDKIKHPLKAFFLTASPVAQSWVNEFGLKKELLNDLISAAQWHPDVKYTGKRNSLIKNSGLYVTKYKNKFGREPFYTAAGASAVGLTLWEAIRKAFRACDISKTNGDVDQLLRNTSAISCGKDRKNMNGYELIVRALAETNMNTFFGKIQFNEHRRNVGFEPITTQIQAETDLEGMVVGKHSIKAVFPVGIAQSVFNYPAHNLHRVKCKPGSFRAPSDFDDCLECKPGMFTDLDDADHCEMCPNGNYADEKGRSECQGCPEGTMTLIRGADSNKSCICRPGFFNTDGEMGVKCHFCVEGAFCAGNTSMPQPLNGFWSDPSSPSQVYPCDPADNCPGEGNECKEGRTGRLCSSCEDGYFSFFQQCIRCWNNALIILASIALLLVWYVINVIVSRSVSSLEMILGWAQLANIIGDVDLNWTSMVNQMFAVANILDFDVDILEPSCMSSWGFKGSFITQLCLPVAMTIMGASGYLGSTLAYLTVKKDWIGLNGRVKTILSYFVFVPENDEQFKKRWDNTVATFLSAVDVTYVTTAKYCFDVFKCDDISNVSVMRVAPDILCHQSDHRQLMGMASLGIGIYVVGYPLYSAWKLYDLSERECLSNPTNLRRFGFIYRMYEPDYTFTPVIVLLRKLLFVLVLVFMNNPAFQIGAIAILINASLMIQIYTAPFVDTYLDVLFSFLLLALMFEAFGGLMFYSENLPEANRDILEWVIMVSSFALVVVFAFIFVMEMTTKYKARFVMKMHRDYARSKRNEKCDHEGNGLEKKWTLKPLVRRLISHQTSIEISSELLATFDPGFVCRALRSDPSLMEEWDQVTQLLKDFMSDQSDCSYLSKKRTAKFWRKLVDRFPELVDFLATTDEETRQKFVDVATNLYRNFYLTKKATRLPLIHVVNWRDYAPMAQWLAIAPEEDRSFFLEFLSKMFHSAGQTEAASTIHAKCENCGKDPHLEKRTSIGSLREKKRGMLNALIRGDDPFFHTALERRLSYLEDVQCRTPAHRATSNLQTSYTTESQTMAPSSLGQPLPDVEEREEEEETRITLRNGFSPSSDDSEHGTCKNVQISVEMPRRMSTDS